MKREIFRTVLTFWIIIANQTIFKEMITVSNCMDLLVADFILLNHQWYQN